MLARPALAPAAVCCALMLLAATAALARPQLVPVDPARPDAEPVAARVTAEEPGRLEFTVQIGALARETVPLAGRDWTALTVPGGDLAGAAGRPGLPTWSTLLVLPSGADPAVTATGGRRQRIGDIDLLPVQPDRAEGPVIDSAWYAAGSRATPDLVTVGEAASLAGQRVVPVTVRPVRYDAGRREVEVLGEVAITLTWPAAAARTPARQAPASLQRVLAHAALNVPAGRDGSDQPAAPGTWLAIAPDIASVTAALEPLVEWRRRQGYHVVVATLAETGSTTSAIKAWLEARYAALDPPLEHVVLVGDATGTLQVPTWVETMSGFYGEGDFYYAQLDGDDILPDVHVGRLSCRNVTELQGIVAKILAYETAPPTTDPNWFERALIVGDPSDSGMTTVYCGEWLAAQLAPLGYGPITEVYGGNYASQMINGLDQGQAMFAYRGFGGMSGFTAGHAAYLSNGGMLSFACFPTCNTGNFRSETVCRSEALLANADGGSIGAIATATGGTHTRYNNCFFHGAWEGMVNSGDHQQGAALTRGKLELFRNYGSTEPHIVEIWSVWNNLMGDPASDVWSAAPSPLAVDHPAALPAAAGALPVTVTALAQPRAGVRVTAVQGEAVLAVAQTDADGQAMLPLPDLSPEPLLITASGHDLRPYRGEAVVADQGRWVALEQWQLDDDAGDGDGHANPGETANVTLLLRNLGSEDATGVAATTTSASPWLTVAQGTSDFGDIAPGRTATGTPAVRLAVAPDAPDGAACPLDVVVNADGETWTSRFTLAVVASRLEADGWAFSSGAPAPGLAGDLVVTLANAGHRDLPAAQAVLRSRSPWLAITDSLAAWGPVAAGFGGSNADDPFAVAFAAICVRGYLAPLTIVLTEPGGAVHRVDLTVPVGEVGVTDPSGPDRHGYYAFDSGDTGYAQAPVYEWVEIDPSRGGAGTDVGLSDFAYEQDDTETVDLPFAFRYYGVEYDQLSICSNGWVALGATDLRHWRNWTVPAAGSPDAMIAVFWDDLVQSGNDRVYRWHDAANHRYVVQWSRMANMAGSPQTCQVILHDPAHHPTLTGDGLIVCQYHTVSNDDTNRGYATVGIQDHTRTDGVLYTYYAEDAPGAAPLAAGLAIAYAPAGVITDAVCAVDPTSLAFAVPAGGQQTRTLHIASEGPAGADLHFAIGQVDPAVSGKGLKNLTGSTLEIAEAEYLPDEPLTLHVTVANASTDDEWIDRVDLGLPPGVTLLGASDLVASNGSLTWQGATGNGVDVLWTGGYIYPGTQASATVDIEVASGLGDVELPWTISGDDWGSPPHSVSGSHTLACLSGTVRIDAPNGGEVWSLGEPRTVAWFAAPDVASVRLELTRDGETWETITDAAPAQDGAYTWTVSGAVSGQCRVRATATDDPSVTDTSNGVFVIQHDLSWLDLSTWSGTVPAGDQLAVDVVADAAGLADGTHEQLLLISHNGGPSLTVPVTLSVGDVTGTEPPPRATILAQNHPNPFNPVTRIDFALAVGGPVELAVYDLAGRRVAVLVDGDLRAGRHTALWLARDAAGRSLPSGTYVYRLVTSAGVQSRKLTLVK